MQITASASFWRAARLDCLPYGLRSALVLLFLAVAGLVSGGTSPAQAQNYNFNAVTIQGNTRVDSVTILSYAKLVKGEPVSAAALNDAYQRIFASGLFEKVELLPQGGTLVIRVTELPMIDVVDYQGNKIINDTDLIAVTKSRARLVYSPAQAEADATALAEKYRSSGRINATINPRIIRLTDNRVDLVFEITEGAVSEIERLNFVGNRDFSDYRLRQVLRTKQAGLLHALIQRDSFSAARLPLDEKLLADFYQSRGYIDFKLLDTTTQYSADRQATFLTFTLQEGRSWKIGKVTTVSEVQGVDAAEFNKLVRLRSGTTYTPTIVDNNASALENLAISKSLNFIRVDPRLTRNNNDGTLDVTFAIVHGDRVFVERIDIEGNTTTLDSVVRRQFGTVEGDPLNPAEIRKSAERIRALGFFSTVSVAAGSGTTADQAVVKVNVTEQPTGSLSFGATYGVSNGFGVNLGFKETNFLGRGQNLDLSVQSGTSTLDSRFIFGDPAILGRDVNFGFRAEYNVSTTNYANYDTRQAILSPSLSFSLQENQTLRLNYTLSKDSILNVATPDSSVIVQADEGTLLTSSVGYSYSFDNRVSAVIPGNGALFRFGQDFAGLGGDTTYIDTSIRALVQTKVLQDQVALRAIFEGGYIQGFNGYDPTVTERFFGNGKIRGFETNGQGPRDLGAVNQDALGGNIYAVAHFETDFPIGLPEEYGITGGAFVDVGSVWGLNNVQGSSGTVDDSLHVRSVIGLVMYWNTPIGPLQLNFTHAIQKESYDKEQMFDLTVATKF